MSRVSLEFGKLVKDLLVKNGMTFRGAGLKSSISAAYWKDMSDGRVPSEEMIEKIAESFEEVDENELRAAAGYSPSHFADRRTSRMRVKARYWILLRR